jgi:hypothetical protein
MVIPVAPQPRRWSSLTLIDGCHDGQGLPASSYAMDKHGQASQSWLVYQYEHVVSGPVNHG